MSLPTPIAVDALPADLERELTVLSDGPKTAIFRHTNGDILFGTLTDRTITDWQVLDGAAARFVEKKWIPRYHERLAEDVERAFRVGADAQEALKLAFRSARFVSELYRTYDETGERRVLAIHPYGAAMALQLDSRGYLLSWRWLSEADGMVEMAKLDALGHPFQGPLRTSLQPCPSIAHAFESMRSEGAVVTYARRWEAAEGAVLDAFVMKSGRAERMGFLMEGWSGGSCLPPAGTRALSLSATNPAPHRTLLRAHGYQIGPLHRTDVDATPTSDGLPDAEVLALVEDLRTRGDLQHLALGGIGFDACLLHHATIDGFLEDFHQRPGVFAAPATLNPATLYAILSESSLCFQIEQGITIWNTPLGEQDLSNLYTAWVDKIHRGLASPPAEPVAGQSFPVGVYRSGTTLVELTHIEGPMAGPRIRPVGHRQLADFFGDVRSSEIIELLSAYLDGHAWPFAAQPGPYGRRGWTFEPKIRDSYATFSLWREGDGSPTEGRGDVLLLCLELLTRALLLPTDGLKSDSAEVESWVGPTRAGHVQLLSILDGAALTPLSA